MRRRWIYLAIVLLSLAAAGWLEWSAARTPERLRGLAEVTDGDSLRVNGWAVRLVGLDAPELTQRCLGGAACGRMARDELRRLILGVQVTCFIDQTDRYERLLARCEARGQSINRQMVARGWAVIDPRYSSDFQSELQAAKAAGNGVHGLGGIQPPTEFRRGETSETMLSDLQTWFRNLLNP